MNVQLENNNADVNGLKELVIKGRFNFIDKDSFEIIKSREDCVVLRSAGYYFKIVKINKGDQRHHFEQFVRNAISQEMSSRGIEWEFFTFSENGHDFFVEKRQQLKLISPSDLPMEEVVGKSKKFQSKVEKRLEFPRLFAQAHNYFKDFEVKKIVLAHDVPFDYEDYAWFNGEIVSLSSTRFFLTFVSQDGKWADSLTAEVVPVILSFGNFYLAKHNIFTDADQSIAGLFEPTSRWWLFDQEVADLAGAKSVLLDELKDMFSANLKIVATKEKQSVYSSEIYGNMLTECERLGLKGSHGVKSLKDVDESSVGNEGDMKFSGGV